jgi:hypothetical protein
MTRLYCLSALAGIGRLPPVDAERGRTWDDRRREGGMRCRWANWIKCSCLGVEKVIEEKNETHSFTR